MPLSIKDPATDRLVRQLAEVTGESITTAVATAVRERLERVGVLSNQGDLARQLDAIAVRCAALPLLDDRAEADILGYDRHGMPA